MEHRSPSEALAALEHLDDDAVGHVLGWLCSGYPDAVLEAVAGVQRHQAVIRQLQQRQAPAS